MPDQGLRLTPVVGYIDIAERNFEGPGGGYSVYLKDMLYPQPMVITNYNERRWHATVQKQQNDLHNASLSFQPGECS